MTSSDSFYTSDSYIQVNPSLHEEDSAWKVSKILPLVDRFMQNYPDKERPVTILDVGGGAGLILRDISAYITKQYGHKVVKYALDLSPGMLERQKKENPDLTHVLNESITKTALCDKQIDLALLIDVLEHIPESRQALKEIRRVTHYAIFKVPLEDCALLNLVNALTRDKQRKREFEKVGHVNFYSMRSFLRVLETYCGGVVSCHYMNVYRYFALNRSTQVLRRFVYLVGWGAYVISPALAGKIFPDFAVALVECKPV